MGVHARFAIPSEVARTEKVRASIRAKIEHPFRYVIRMFGYDRVRQQGLYKNAQRLSLGFGFTNLLIGDTYELCEP